MLSTSQIQRALHGDPSAQKEVVLALLPEVKVEVALCLRRYASSPRRDSRQDIDDFSHEIVVFLLADGGRALQKFDPTRGSLSSFIRMIARQRVARKLKGHRGNPWSEELFEPDAIEPLVEPDFSAQGLEARELLRAVLAGLRADLTPRGLQLFERLYVEQRSIAEVAAEFSMTRGAIDAWNSRIRMRARALAEELPMKRC